MASCIVYRAEISSTYSTALRPMLITFILLAQAWATQSSILSIAHEIFENSAVVVSTSNSVSATSLTTILNETLPNLQANHDQGKLPQIHMLQQSTTDLLSNLLLDVKYNKLEELSIAPTATASETILHNHAELLLSSHHKITDRLGDEHFSVSRPQPPRVERTEATKVAPTGE